MPSEFIKRPLQNFPQGDDLGVGVAVAIDGSLRLAKRQLHVVGRLGHGQLELGRTHPETAAQHQTLAKLATVGELRMLLAPVGLQRANLDCLVAIRVFPTSEHIKHLSARKPADNTCFDLRQVGSHKLVAGRCFQRLTDCAATREILDVEAV